jgi:hypothetical protein
LVKTDDDQVYIYLLRTEAEVAILHHPVSRRTNDHVIGIAERSLNVEDGLVHTEPNGSEEVELGKRPGILLAKKPFEPLEPNISVLAAQLFQKIRQRTVKVPCGVCTEHGSHGQFSYIAPADSNRNGFRHSQQTPMF